ncbi:hypothetical protein HW45_04965 [Vibrio sp. ER1A]|nr:hypothetical protein HW45_04965 [Vibrio sp. ER1A]
MLPTKRVLLVDDTEVNNFILADILANIGIDTVSCTTTEEAINKLSMYHFDLVITDIVLPHQDGYILAQYVAFKFNNTLPLISSSSDAIEKHYEHLFKYQISKPFIATDVKTKVELALKLDKEENSKSNELVDLSIYKEELLSVTKNDIIRVRHALKKQDIISVRKIVHRMHGAINMILPESYALIILSNVKILANSFESIDDNFKQSILDFLDALNQVLDEE